MSVDSNILGSGEGAAKIKVGEVKRAEESIRRDDRVEKKIDAGNRSAVGGEGAGRLKAITPSRTAYAAVNVRGEGAEGARDGEGRRGPLFLWDGVEVSGGCVSEVDGTEGASGLDQLHQFGVAGEKPLQVVRAREGRTEGERRARRVEV